MNKVWRIFGMLIIVFVIGLSSISVRADVLNNVNYEYQLLDNGDYDHVEDIPNPTTPEQVCSPLGILKDDINDVFDMFKIVVPIIVIGMSVYDFVKAIPGKVEGDLKKAFQKLLKRLVFAVIFFFLPLVLNYVLGLIDPGYHTCVNV